MEIGPLQEDEIGSFIDNLWISAQHERAAASDYTLVSDIRKKGLTYPRSRLSDDDAVTYLARRGPHLIGYVAAEVQSPPPIFQQVRECHINELFVRKKDRRQGVASELLDTVEDWGLSHGCERFDLNVDKENRAAKELYEMKGYNIKRYNMKKEVKNDE